MVIVIIVIDRPLSTEPRLVGPVLESEGLEMMGLLFLPVSQTLVVCASMCAHVCVCGGTRTCAQVCRCTGTPLPHLSRMS